MDSVKRKRNEAGFSLIELGVVIGVLAIVAAVAIPGYYEAMAKAHQAEAKFGLSAIFSLEKTFYSEYGAYVPSMTAIGYEPDGNKRFYQIGWDGSSGLYSHHLTEYDGDLDTPAFPELNSPFAHCDLTAIAGASSTNSAPFDVDDPQSFIAGCAGHIRSRIGNATCDQWLITETKNMRNVQIGY